MAERMNRVTMSAQAVGGAVGHNPISIIIPCHRVVGTTGSLTGYAGGVDKKIWLLKHEGVDRKDCLYLRRGRRFEGKEMFLKKPCFGIGLGTMTGWVVVRKQVW